MAHPAQKPRQKKSRDRRPAAGPLSPQEQNALAVSSMPREARLAASLLLGAAGLSAIQGILDVIGGNGFTGLGFAVFALIAWRIFTWGRGLGRILISVLAAFIALGLVLTVVVVAKVSGRPEGDPIRQQLLGGSSMAALVLSALVALVYGAILFFAWKAPVSAWINGVTERRLAEDEKTGTAGNA